MRMIDADLAFETIVDLSGQADTKSAYAAYWKAGRAIQNLPTVDAVEVVHGRWENYDPDLDGYRCSRCKLSHRCCTPYCPNCGAKMDGGERQ